MESHDVTTRLETFSNILYSNVKLVESGFAVASALIWCGVGYRAARLCYIHILLYDSALLSRSLLHINEYDSSCYRNIIKCALLQF